MLQGERILEYQERLIKKFETYLHLLNMEAVSIEKEDVEKLSAQTASGTEITGDIQRINNVIKALYRDLSSVNLLTEGLAERYNSNSVIIKKYEKSSRELVIGNLKTLADLRYVYKNRILKFQTSIGNELKIVHSSSFLHSSEMLDITV